MLTEREAVEIFHLLFLRAFGARVDKALFVLKGGCNLRFFYRSIRYSEDIDLDIRTMAAATLRGNVDRVLEGPAFQQVLRTQQLEIVQISRPKQTDTTQRWKVGVRLIGPRADVPTKIEFSRRPFSSDVLHEAVSAEIVRRYRLYPVLVQHYGPGAALAQKVAALALRSQTQARDIFDLKSLLDGGVPPGAVGDVIAHVPRAIENALSIGYDAFVGQVVAFLEPEYQEHYRDRATWDALQEQVVHALEVLQA